MFYYCFICSAAMSVMFSWLIHIVLLYGKLSLSHYCVGNSAIVLFFSACLVC